MCRGSARFETGRRGTWMMGGGRGFGGGVPGGLLGGLVARLMGVW